MVLIYSTKGEWCLLISNPHLKPTYSKSYLQIFSFWLWSVTKIPVKNRFSLREGTQNNDDWTWADNAKKKTNKQKNWRDVYLWISSLSRVSVFRAAASLLAQLVSRFHRWRNEHVAGLSIFWSLTGYRFVRNKIKAEILKFTGNFRKVTLSG